MTLINEKEIIDFIEDYQLQRRDILAKLNPLVCMKNILKLKMRRRLKLKMPRRKEKEEKRSDIDTTRKNARTKIRAFCVLLHYIYYLITFLQILKIPLDNRCF